MNQKIANYKKFIEANIIEAKNEEDLDLLLKLNSSAISNFQAERLIHLIVTMSFALFTLVFIYFYLFFDVTIFGIVCLITIVVLIFYILHYYKLENGVQSLLEYDQKILNRKKELDQQKLPTNQVVTQTPQFRTGL
ncbi:MAG TPA: hypothetical protein P5014_00530 [Patescibacteria group bacterium]|nr:hypothetical protein [Patescibacteria group bacterium]